MLKRCYVYHIQSTLSSILWEFTHVYRIVCYQHPPVLSPSTSYSPFISHRVPPVVSLLAWVQDLPVLNGHLEHTLPAPTVFSCQSSLVRGRTLWALLLPVLDFWLAWSCIGLVLATIHACNDADSFRRHYFSTFLPNNSHSYNISFPSSAVFPETRTSPFLYDVRAPRTLRYIRTQQS